MKIKQASLHDERDGPNVVPCAPGQSWFLRFWTACSTFAAAVGAQHASIISGNKETHPSGARAIQRIGFHSLLNGRPRIATKTRLTSHVAINCGWPT
jgi:hypothetical protein